MKVMVNGNNGEIRTTAVRLLKEADRQSVGIDSGSFEGCWPGAPPVPVARAIRKDFRVLHVGFDRPRFLLIECIQQLINQELLDRDFRWIPQHAHA